MTTQLCFFIIFGSYFWGWGKHGEPKEDGSMTEAEARNIMSESGNNPDLVKWMDFAIYCFLGYAGLNVLFILIISVVNNVVGTILFIHSIQNLLFFFRFYVAIKGCTVHWTDAQRAMRLPDNPDTRQREAADKIRSGADAIIWLGGFLDIVCCPCILGIAFVAIKAMSSI